MRQPIRNLPFACVGALGIGLATLIFSIADPYLGRPLPYASEDQLVSITVSTEGLSRGVPIPTLDDWRARQDLVTGVTSFLPSGQVKVRSEHALVAMNVAEVSPNFFVVLGADVPGVLQLHWDTVPSSTIAVTPAGMALLERAMIGSRPDTLLFEDGTRSAVVYLPDSFIFPDPVIGQNIHVLRPTSSTALVNEHAWRPDGRPSGRAGGPGVVARVTPGVTTDQVAETLATPLSNGRRLKLTTESLPAEMRKSMRNMALGALVAGLLVTMVCLGNLVNLLTTQAAFREVEFHTRRALGARSSDLVALQLAELAVLIFAAAIGGVLLAVYAFSAIAQVMPVQLTQLGSPGISGRSVGFAFSISIVYFGLLGAISTIRLIAPVRRSLHTGASSRKTKTVRMVVTASQSALALLLAVVATTLVRSYSAMASQETGYNPSAISITTSYPIGAAPARLKEDVDRTVVELSRANGVVAAGASTGSVVNDGLHIKRVRTRGNEALVNSAEVTPDFFAAAGTKVIQGRPLIPSDRGWSAVVVNSSFVTTHLDGQNPVGQLVEYAARPATIVGVVENALDRSLDASARPVVYSVLEAPMAFSITYVALPADQNATSQEELVRVVRKANSDVIVLASASLGDRLGNSVREKVFATLIISIFCAAAVSVTTVGLVAIVSFVGARRRREVAIHLALGASRMRVNWLIASEAVLASLGGGVVGILLGRSLSASLAALTFGVEPGSWVAAFTGGSAVLTLMALSAFAQTRRVTRIQPAESLRHN